jgi:hypothetical protein
VGGWQAGRLGSRGARVEIRRGFPRHRRAAAGSASAPAPMMPAAALLLKLIGG